MSCGQPAQDEVEDQLPPATPLAQSCVRCSLPPTIQVRTTSYCCDHFLDHLMFVYRRGIDSARQWSRTGPPPSTKRGPKRSKVLLAFSGGISSRVLLDLVQQNNFTAPDDPSLQNPRFRPSSTFEGLEVLYVDESGLPGFGPDRTEEVRAIVEQSTPFPFRSVKLESVFEASTSLSTSLSSPSLPSTSSGSPTATPLESLNALLSPITHSPTSLTALHAALLQSLLRKEATASGCEILLTGENAGRVAVKTLAGMAEGRGWSLGEEVGVSWEVEGGLLVARPVSGMLGKEVEYYAGVKGLRWVEMESPRTAMEGEARRKGIEALTEEFVNGLEVNFPSTVSTILRTAQKLGMRSVDAKERSGGAENTPCCPLCGLPAQVGAEDWRKAITISSFSEHAALPAVAESSRAAPSTDLAPLLCYSCLLVLQGSKPSRANDGVDAVEQRAPLPSYVGEAMRRRTGQPEAEAELLGVRVKSEKEMGEVVKEFLLND